jgi:peptidoglycan hydrolase FlgJ
MSSTATTPAALKSYADFSAAAKAQPGTREAKAHKTAQGFEGVFLQNMLENMMSGLQGDGPLGGGQAGGGAWRGFLMDEMSKSMTKNGSIGIAPQVYREMIQIQERAGAGR